MRLVLLPQSYLCAKVIPRLSALATKLSGRLALTAPASLERSKQG